MAKKASKKVAPKQEKPRHNDEQYGEVLYAYSYTMDDENYLNAASLVGPGRIQQIITSVSMVFLVLITVALYNEAHRVYPLAIASFVLFIALSILNQNWTKVRNRYVAGTDLNHSADSARHVVVTPEKIVVEGPGDTVRDYALSEVKSVAEDSDGALIKLGQKRYVYAPRRSFSESRYTGLVQFLREKSA